MCAMIGLNVNREGRYAPDRLVQMGAQAIRIVATPDIDLRPYFKKCRQAGLKILLVFARESGRNDVFDYADYARRYAGLIDAIQVGNEPDLESESSWTMSHDTLAKHGRSVRSQFPDTHLVLGGLASGHPDWLRGMDLSWCDSIGVHPYLKDAPNPHDIEDLPDVPDLLEAYRQYGRPVVVTEWGWWGHDERRGAEEVEDMIGWAANSTLIEGFFYFCASDAMVPPFGLTRADGSPKPALDRYRNQARLAVPTGWPQAPINNPEPSPPQPVPPAPAKPDPWKYFTAEQIAGVTNCPLQPIRENWPRLAEQLWHCQIDDRMTQIAMIATVAIETARTFAPVREAFWLDEDWRRRNLRYYPYYGRGYIQATWESNYRKYGVKTAELWRADPSHPDFDYVGNPDQMLDPDFSAAFAALYFRDHGGDFQRLIPEAARVRNWREVRRLVQGGDAGLNELVEMATRLDAIQPAPPADDPNETIKGLETAVKYLVDVVIPGIAESSERREQLLLEARRVRSQFVED